MSGAANLLDPQTETRSRSNSATSRPGSAAELIGVLGAGREDVGDHAADPTCPCEDPDEHPLVVGHTRSRRRPLSYAGRALTLSPGRVSLVTTHNAIPRQHRSGRANGRRAVGLLLHHRSHLSRDFQAVAGREREQAAVGPYLLPPRPAPQASQCPCSQQAEFDGDYRQADGATRPRPPGPVLPVLRSATGTRCGQRLRRLATDARIERFHLADRFVPRRDARTSFPRRQRVRRRFPRLAAAVHVH